MERIEVLKEDCVDRLNVFLKEGWKVKMICPFSQSVAKAEGWGHEHGIYGAYVVLTKGGE